MNLAIVKMNNDSVPPSSYSSSSVASVVVVFSFDTQVCSSVCFVVCIRNPITTKEILFHKCADERKPSVARFFHFKCTHNVIIFLLHYSKFRFSASVVDIGILHKSSMHVLDYKLIRLIACKMQ